MEATLHAQHADVAKTITEAELNVAKAKQLGASAGLTSAQTTQQHITNMTPQPVEQPQQAQQEAGPTLDDLQQQLIKNAMDEALAESGSQPAQNQPAGNMRQASQATQGPTGGQQGIPLPQEGLST